MTPPGPRPEPACDADPMALPELDVARVQRWCAGRVPEHALHQVRVECEVAPRHLTIIERRARGLRAGVEQLPHRPPALQRRRPGLVVVLARPQPALSRLRPARAIATGRGPPRRDRPQSHRHLLGLIPPPAARQAPTRLDWGHLRGRAVGGHRQAVLLTKRKGGTRFPGAPL